MLGKETSAGARVYQVVIRVRAEGLQAIVKVRRGDYYGVCFVGAGSFPALSAKVRDVILAEEENFKVDKYPPT